MSERGKEVLEVAGFNGVPSVECGRSLPIVRRPSDGMYCVLETETQALATWFSEEEAIAFAKAGRWTRLGYPVPFSRSKSSISNGQSTQPVMVIFADQSLLDYAGQPTWPVQVRGEFLRRCHLLGRSESIRAACAPANIVEALLDDWAGCLQKRYDAMYGAGREQEVPTHCRLYARAAKSRAIRWQAYLRYALAQSPERVRQVFDTFTKSEFPDVPWQSYLDQMEDLGRLLKSVTAGKPQSTVPAPAQSATVRSKLQGIAGRQPLRSAA